MSVGTAISGKLYALEDIWDAHCRLADKLGDRIPDELPVKDGDGKRYRVRHTRVRGKDRYAIDIFRKTFTVTVNGPGKAVSMKVLSKGKRIASAKVRMVRSEDPDKKEIWYRGDLDVENAAFALIMGAICTCLADRRQTA